MTRQPVKGTVFTAPLGSITVAGAAQIIAVADDDGIATDLFADEDTPDPVVLPYAVPETGSFALWAEDGPRWWDLTILAGTETAVRSVVNRSPVPYSADLASSLAALTAEQLAPLAAALGVASTPSVFESGVYAQGVYV